MKNNIPDQCEIGFHPRLELVESDGYGLWQCIRCGEYLDELEIMNRAVDEACDRMLSVANQKEHPCFGSQKMNEIVKRMNTNIKNA